MGTFTTQSPKLQALANAQQNKVQQLEELLGDNAKVYIDYANVLRWSEKLAWRIDLKRLRQFLAAFTGIKEVSLYTGVLSGDQRSEKFVADAEKLKYRVVTKPVKIMRHSIDASSVANNSPELLNHFMRQALIRRFDVETIEFMNGKLKQLNTQGHFFVEDRKCNFDVEIGLDMIEDCLTSDTDTYILWSADSDFEDLIKRLQEKKKKVIVVGVAGRVAHEINELAKNSDLFIYDIRKIKKFICYSKEIGL